MWANLVRFVVSWPGHCAQLVRAPGPLLIIALLVGTGGVGRALAEGDGGGALRVLIDTEPVHLNPVLDPDLWGYRIAHDLICEPLIRARPSASATNPADFEGVLAERFSMDADGAAATFTLRHGVRFQDGRALTAHDVRFTLERVFESARSAPRTQSLLADLSKVEVLSLERVRVELRRPRSRLLAALAEIDILPEHVYGESASMAHLPQNRRPVCTGPYRLAEWRHGAQLVLRRNPAYWGAPPPVEELRFQVVPDTARALTLLRRGEADVLGHLPALYYPEQVEPAMLRGKLRTLEVPASQAALLLWNARQPALAAPAVRRALAALIDRERLVREVRHGLAEARALPPPLLEPGGLGGDLAATEAALDTAGLTRLTPGGARAFHGRPLTLAILVPAGSTEAAQVVRRIGEGLARAGIGVHPEPLDLPSLQTRLRRGAFDAAFLAWAWTGPAPDLWPLLHRGGSQNYTGVEIAELDAALDAVRHAADPAALAAAERRLAGVLREEEPVTFLYRPRQVLLLGSRVASGPALAGDFLLLRALGLGTPSAK